MYSENESLDERIDYILDECKAHSVKNGDAYFYPAVEVKLRDYLREHTHLVPEIIDELDIINKYENYLNKDQAMAEAYKSAIDLSEDSAVNIFEGTAKNYQYEEREIQKQKINYTHGIIKGILEQVEPMQGNCKWWEKLQKFHQEILECSTNQPDVMEDTAALLCEIVKSKEKLQAMKYDEHNAYEVLLRTSNELFERVSETYFIEGAPYSHAYRKPREQKDGEPHEEPLPSICHFSAETSNIILPKLANIAHYYGSPFEEALQENIRISAEHQKETANFKKALGTHTANALKEHSVLAELAELDILKGGSSKNRADIVSRGGTLPSALSFSRN